MAKRTREYIKSRRKNQRKLRHALAKYGKELDKSFDNMLLYGMDEISVDASSRLNKVPKVTNTFVPPIMDLYE